MLAIVVGLATGAGIIIRRAGLPAMLGYILAGAVISGVGWGRGLGVVGELGQLGVTLLLFLVGLELPISQLVRLGRTVLVSGGAQIAVTSVVGFVLARWMGFTLVEAIFLGVALTFSSTIVVVKLLSEKKELQSLHGRIAMGSLLVQDFVAIGLLVVLSGWGKGAWSGPELVGVIIKGLVLVAATFGLAEMVVSRLVKSLAANTETLFAFSLAWCLGIAALAASPIVGFSAEVGGLLAGLTLANAAEHFQVMARVRPVRDFFMLLFFVGLGASLTVGGVGDNWWRAAVLSAYVLIGNPLIMLAILTWMGYSKRTAFLAGLTMGQISEFSLIVVAAAVRSGQVGDRVVATVAMVGVVTMTICSYLISHGEKFYVSVSRFIPGRKRTGRKGGEEGIRSFEVVLFGHSRAGSVIRPALERLGKKIMVVDFDPQVVEKLEREGKLVVYGDMSDVELYDELGLKNARLVVSTVSDLSDNLQLLEVVKSKTKKGPKVVTTAVDGAEAKVMYAAGADYVLVPNHAGGELLARVIEEQGIERIDQWGKTQLAGL